MSATRLCDCGCGAAVRRGRAYLHGHNRRKPLRYTLDPATGCWIWDGSVSNDGYGQFRERMQPGKGTGRTLKAHRYFYEQAKGPIPAGLQLDHLCRNRRCVNPDHLEPVTNTENVRRGAWTKLNRAAVRDIRTSTEPLRVLAQRYGTTAKYVSKLRGANCDRWADVERAAA